jgi:hypothetical protein
MNQHLSQAKRIDGLIGDLNIHPDQVERKINSLIAQGGYTQDEINRQAKELENAMHAKIKSDIEYIRKEYDKAAIALLQQIETEKAVISHKLTADQSGRFSLWLSICKNKKLDEMKEQYQFALQANDLERIYFFEDVYAESLPGNLEDESFRLQVAKAKGKRVSKDTAEAFALMNKLYRVNQLLQEHLGKETKESFNHMLFASGRPGRTRF